ncbi:MAG: hypothetical protein HY042_11815, partial [Spirochaetia bacterium]|nr:hypothetical protein [Spirochaetia bacterium]
QKLINQELEGLRKELAAQGIQVDSIVVHVREAFQSPAQGQDQPSNMSAFQDSSGHASQGGDRGHGEQESGQSNTWGSRALEKDMEAASHIVFTEEYASVNVKA